MENKKKIIIALSILLMAILCIGGVYAWLRVSVVSQTENIVHAGKLDLVLDDDASDGIQMKDTVPLTDKKGENQEGYTFSLINRGVVNSQYTIYLDDLDIEDGKTRMDDSVVRYILERDGEELSRGLLPNLGFHPNRILDTGTIESKKTHVYNLKVWMDKDTDIEYMGTVFATRIRVEAEQTTTSSKKIDLELTPTSTEKVPLKDGENLSDFTYTSSDLSVVTVDADGNIVVVGPGYANIIKTDLSGRREDISVHVTVPVEVAFETNDKIDSIGSISKSTCNLAENNQSTCKIKVPEVTVKEGYEFVGWSTNQDSHEGELNRVEVSSENNTLYPIVKVPQRTLTATFEKQGDGIESIEHETLTCETAESYNEEASNTECEITLPEMTVKEGYEVIGWNTSSGATSGEEMNSKVMISSNVTYYTIYIKAKKRFTATFKLNGAKSLNGKTASELENDALKITCEVDDSYSGVTEESCEIAVPTIEASDVTPIVIGFNEIENATAPSISGDTITLSENKVYYALTRNESKTYTATFYRNGAVSLNKEGIDFTQKECTIPATYNGETQDSSCEIMTPTIEPSDNTPNVLGYSASSDNHKCDYQAGTSIQIQEDGVYYAQTSSDVVNYRVIYKPGSYASNIREEYGICTVPSSYNGEKQKENCTLAAPDYDVDEEKGYQKLGFSDQEDDTTGSMNIVVSEDNTTFYANASKSVAVVEYYSDGVKIGSSYTNGTNATLIPIEDLDVTKPGYGFKGWATIEGSSDVMYEDGGTITSLSNSDVRKIYAVWEDNQPPVCKVTFPSGNYIIGDTTEVTLTCTDEGSGFENRPGTFIQPVASYSDNFETKDGRKVESFYFSPNDMCKFDGNTMTCKIWAYTNCTSNNATIKIPEFAVSDRNGNKSSEIVSNAVTIKGKTLTATKVGVKGVSNLESTAESCDTVGPYRSCSVNLGNVTLKDGYRWAGWNSDKTATTGEQEVELSENQEFYPIVEPILVGAYVYDETKVNPTDENDNNRVCVTGEESTCKVSECYKDGQGPCAPGTIFKYAVKSTYDNNRVDSLDDNVYYFYTIEDKGTTITMQSREDVNGSAIWSDDLANGPTVAIELLEEQTKDWDYVDTQTYTMGTTVFGNSNINTGFGNYSTDTRCSVDGTRYNCNKSNKSGDYSWNERSAKARLMTTQEALSVGCTAINGNCPIWMYNYLDASINQGGTNNASGHRYYHLMNATTIPNYSMFIMESRIAYNHRRDPRTVRPVIELNKNRFVK